MSTPEDNKDIPAALPMDPPDAPPMAPPFDAPPMDGGAPAAPPFDAPPMGGVPDAPGAPGAPALGTVAKPAVKISLAVARSEVTQVLYDLKKVMSPVTPPEPEKALLTIQDAITYIEKFTSENPKESKQLTKMEKAQEMIIKETQRLAKSKDEKDKTEHAALTIITKTAGERIADIKKNWVEEAKKHIEKFTSKNIEQLQPDQLKIELKSMQAVLSTITAEKMRLGKPGSKQDDKLKIFKELEKTAEANIAAMIQATCKYIEKFTSANPDRLAIELEQMKEARESIKAEIGKLENKKDPDSIKQRDELMKVKITADKKIEVISLAMQERILQLFGDDVPNLTKDNVRVSELLRAFVSQSPPTTSADFGSNKKLLEDFNKMMIFLEDFEIPVFKENIKFKDMKSMESVIKDTELARNQALKELKDVDEQIKENQKITPDLVDEMLVELAGQSLIDLLASKKKLEKNIENFDAKLKGLSKIEKVFTAYAKVRSLQSVSLSQLKALGNKDQTKKTVKAPEPESQSKVLDSDILNNIETYLTLNADPELIKGKKDFAEYFTALRASKNSKDTPLFKIALQLGVNPFQGSYSEFRNLLEERIKKLFENSKAPKIFTNMAGKWGGVSVETTKDGKVSVKGPTTSIATSADLNDNFHKIFYKNLGMNSADDFYLRFDDKAQKNTESLFSVKAKEALKKWNERNPPKPAETKVAKESLKTVSSSSTADMAAVAGAVQPEVASQSAEKSPSQSGTVQAPSEAAAVVSKPIPTEASKAPAVPKEAEALGQAGLAASASSTIEPKQNQEPQAAATPQGPGQVAAAATTSSLAPGASAGPQQENQQSQAGLSPEKALPTQPAVSEKPVIAPDTSDERIAMLRRNIQQSKDDRKAHVEASHIQQTSVNNEINQNQAKDQIKHTEAFLSAFETQRKTKPERPENMGNRLHKTLNKLKIGDDLIVELNSYIATLEQTANQKKSFSFFRSDQKGKIAIAQEVVNQITAMSHGEKTPSEILENVDSLIARNKKAHGSEHIHGKGRLTPLLEQYKEGLNKIINLETEPEAHREKPKK